MRPGGGGGAWGLGLGRRGSLTIGIFQRRIYDVVGHASDRFEGFMGVYGLRSPKAKEHRGSISIWLRILTGASDYGRGVCVSAQYYCKIRRPRVKHMKIVMYACLTGFFCFFVVTRGRGILLNPKQKVSPLFSTSEPMCARLE